MRKIISFILVFAFMFSFLVIPNYSQTNEESDNDQYDLTPQEEHEARVLVQNFTRRFEETKDIGVLFDEFFTRDFIGSRTQYPEALLPFAFVCRSTAAEADAAQWQRYYVATVNFYVWSQRLYIAGEFDKSLSDENEENDMPPMEELYTKEIVVLMKSDDLLRSFLNMTENENELDDKTKDACNTFECDCPDEQDNETPKSITEDRGINIKTVERLNRVSEILEKASKLAQEKYEKLQEEKHKQGLSEINFPEKISALIAAAENDNEEIKPSVTVEEKGVWGKPEFKRLICFQTLGFHVDMVRDTNGQLKIISVGLFFND